MGIQTRNHGLEPLTRLLDSKKCPETEHVRSNDDRQRVRQRESAGLTYFCFLKVVVPEQFKGHHQRSRPLT